MNILKTIVIDRTPQEVWQLVAKEFDQAYLWMDFVKKSYPLNELTQNQTAPIPGRVCEFTDDPNGLKAKEQILSYSEKDMQFSFDVIPVDAPKIFPVKKNIVTMSVKAISDDQSQVSWESNITLSALGILLYPILRRGLSKNFAGVLKDLKNYLEVSNQTFSAKSA